jgi:UDP-glucose 4-epimerase
VPKTQACWLYKGFSVKMNILITGGTGYVGSSIAVEVLKAYPEYNITIIDDMIRGNNIEQLNYYNGKIDLIKKNLENLKQGELKSYNFDIVIHCAASAYVGESEKIPQLYLNRNTLATTQLLNSLNFETLKKFIFSSTCAVYGNHLGEITESISLNPTSPYGWSKLISENIIQAYAEKFDFSATIFRYFNVAGAIVENSTGERHFPETHLIPLIYDSWQKKQKISIFGGDYNTKDGTCAREYVHIFDIVKAHTLTIKNQNLQKVNIINLCTGSPVTNIEVLRAAETAWNCKLEYEIVARRPGDAESLYGVNNKAKELLGWLPKNSDINQILRDYKTWKEKEI